MTRVLVVSHAAVNGPHRKPYDLLARDPGWEVHLAVPAAIPLGNGQVKVCEEAPPGAAYQLHQLPLAFAETGRFMWFRGLTSLVRRVRPDVVFAEYDPGSLPVLHSALAGAGVGAPVVAFTVENIHHARFRDAFANLRARRLKLAARDGVVGVLELAGSAATRRLACISDEGARIFLQEKRWTKPVHVMPLGTDTEMFKPIASEELRASLGLARRFVVGYFGRLVHEKGVDVLIDALAGLPADVWLLLDMFTNFAPGSFAANLLARADSLGVRDRIVTIDVPHEDVPQYMNCCDVLALPSRSTPRWKEQFGRVLPEAMSCGVPVIGTNTGNIPDVIGDAGLLVEQASPKALIDGILQLKEDPELRRSLAVRGRRRVLERLSVEVQTRQLKEILSPDLRPPKRSSA